MGVSESGDGGGGEVGKEPGRDGLGSRSVAGEEDMWCWFDRFDVSSGGEAYFFGGGDRDVPAVRESNSDGGFGSWYLEVCGPLGGGAGKSFIAMCSHSCGISTEPAVI